MGFSNSHCAKREISFPGFCCLLACLFFNASFSTAASASGQKLNDTSKKSKNRSIRWDPPNVDKPLKSVRGAPPCILTDVLQKAGARAKEMKDNLPNFTADEKIEYQSTSDTDDLLGYGSGTFEYLVVLAPTSWGASVQEIRTPTKGTRPFAASSQDRGLAEMALIFLPELQSDYGMKCDGEARWEGRATWVIHFQQRAGITGHTFSYQDGNGGVYVAKLRGRAWISADSGDVLRLETALAEGVPAVHVRNSWLSIDYGPVQFHSRNIRFWLPQTVDAYTQFSDHRTITYHTFANFMLFSVQAKQKIEKPTKPQ
jgi:hypothetical protein